MRELKQWHRPFFSVLIDTYNHERFIEEAVASVLGPGFSHLRTGNRYCRRRLYGSYTRNPAKVLERRQGSSGNPNGGRRVRLTLEPRELFRRSDCFSGR